MSQILIDTDVFSYINDARHDAKKFRFLLQGREIFISFISVGEAIAGGRLGGWSLERINVLRESILTMQTLHSDDEIVERYALLISACKERGHALFKPENRLDAWIAATAIAHGMPLLTNNLRHFRGTPGLSLIEHEEVT